MSKAALTIFYGVSLLLLVVALQFQFRSKDLCISSASIISVKGPGFDIENCHEHFRPFIAVTKPYLPKLLRDLETLLDSPFWGRRAPLYIVFSNVDSVVEHNNQLVLPEAWLDQGADEIRQALTEYMISKKWPEWTNDHFQMLVLRDFIHRILASDIFYEFRAPNTNFVRSLQTASELCQHEKSNPLCANPHWNKHSPQLLTIWHFKTLLVETLYEAYRDSSLHEQHQVLQHLSRGVKKLPTPTLPKDLREIQDWREWFKNTAVDFSQSFAVNSDQLNKILFLKGVTGDFGLDTLVIVSSSVSTEFKHKLNENLKKKLGHRGPWLVVEEQPTQHSPFLLARAQGLRLRQVISYQCGHPQPFEAQSYYVKQFDLIQDCESISR